MTSVLKIYDIESILSVLVGLLVPALLFLVVFPVPVVLLLLLDTFLYNLGVFNVMLSW